MTCGNVSYGSESLARGGGTCPPEYDRCKSFRFHLRAVVYGAWGVGLPHIYLDERSEYLAKGGGGRMLLCGGGHHHLLGCDHIGCDNLGCDCCLSFLWGLGEALVPRNSIRAVDWTSCSIGGDDTLNADARICLD